MWSVEVAYPEAQVLDVVDGLVEELGDVGPPSGGGGLADADVGLVAGAEAVRRTDPEAALQAVYHIEHLRLGLSDAADGGPRARSASHPERAARRRLYRRRLF